MQQKGRVWLDGIRAVARLPLERSNLDTRQGLNTGGYISGYRGSPLGSLDQRFGEIHHELTSRHIEVNPGINEDLAATAIWGTQQTGLFEGSRFDGVFGMWYGKAPGLDRSGDAVRHANHAGTSRHGGVLMMVGDDPSCKSSTLPSFSAGTLRDLKIPILDPATIRDILEFGLYGWELSRYSGLWVAMLCQTALMDSSANFDLDAWPPAFILPPTDESPHIRLQDTPLDQSDRMALKLNLLHQFERFNRINRCWSEPVKPALSIISSGHHFVNLREALRVLGFKDSDDLEKQGIQVIKLGMLWPIASDWLKTKLSNVEEILVVEGPNRFIEDQIYPILYRNSGATISRVGEGNSRTSTAGSFAVAAEQMIRSVGDMLQRRGIEIPDRSVYDRICTFDGINALANANHTERRPLFCAGCPHAISTRIPEGSRALAGIGCHYMAQWMDRSTDTFTQMGGEGVNWLGQAPFTDTEHVFVNLGDGTYFHSGLLAIRAAVASGVNVTYKVLFNDAVAMTGGQSVDGSLSVADVVAQLRAEGVAEVVVVSDEPARYTSGEIDVRHRSELDVIQRKLRTVRGCSALIFDQTCAAEKRRRRKRGLTPISKRHLVINDALCEDCGDCTAKSNCSAIEPIETDLGVKRRINATTCNQDLSCLEGFCPAIVEIEGTFKQSDGIDIPPVDETISLPEYANIFIAGVGGTGVVTLSQMLCAAAHIEGKYVTSLDQTGLAQKGGAVTSHVRINPTPFPETNISSGRTDVLLGCDLVTATDAEVMKLFSHRTYAFINKEIVPTLDYILENKNSEFSPLIRRLSDVVAHVDTVDLYRWSSHASGSTTTANTLMLGYAWQSGQIPLQAESIRAAIKLNGVQIAANIHAFEAGRALRAGSLQFNPGRRGNYLLHPPKYLKGDQLLDDREQLLQQYQDEAYAHRLRAGTQEVRSRFADEVDHLVDKYIRTYFKLLYVKDEYEVARCLVSSQYQSILDHQFESDYRVTYGFGSPWLTRWRQSEKVQVGTIFKPFLRILAKLKSLRGTALDMFKHSRERQIDRNILGTFENDVNLLIEATTNEADRLFDALLNAYKEVRGYGKIREKNWESIQPRLFELRKRSAQHTVNEERQTAELETTSAAN